MKIIWNMADPQFEQFREVFDKLPQHIKAPTYCYRLAHDIAFDGLDTGEEDDELNCTVGFHPINEVLSNGHHDNYLAQNGSVCTDFVTNNECAANNSNSNLREDICMDRCIMQCNDNCSKPSWIANTISSTQQAPTSTGRKRRRLPEIPKNKPAFSTSIVFKTRALSLAEEISEAEKNSQTSSNVISEHKGSEESPLLFKLKKHPKRLFPFRKCPRFAVDDDSSPEEKILNTDIDSGNSTAHSPDGAKSFSPAVNGSCSPSSPVSSSGVSTTTLESLEATHRGLHKFIPRHHDEVEIEIGDPLYVQREADDLWCEGINLRTGKSGIFPSAYVTDVEYTDFDPDSIKVKKERFLLKFLGSIEVTCNKGNDVLCQAIRKITLTKEGEGMPPHPCILEIGDHGLRMVDKSKPLPNDVPCHDYFFCLKNISFCGFHPHDYRYFGFITKHPTQQRFACHVFIGDDSTRPVAEAVGRAFQRFYQKFIETAYPVEDIYLE